MSDVFSLNGETVLAARGIGAMGAMGSMLARALATAGLRAAAA